MADIFRLMRPALYFIIGVLLVFDVSMARAETIAATPSTAIILYAGTSTAFGYSTTGYMTSPELVCAALQAQAPTYPVSWNGVSGVGAGCVITTPTGGAYGTQILGVAASCSGMTVPYAGACSSVYSCPDSPTYPWTLSGSSCNRTTPCTATTANASGYFQMSSGDPSSFPAVVCAAGCLSAFSGTAPARVATVGGVKTYYAQGSFNGLGAGAGDVCTAGSGSVLVPTPMSSVPAASCGSGQGSATMNGVTVCVNNSTGSTTPAPTAPVASSTAGQTTSVTSGTTQTDTTVTTGSDGSVTTTTTTTNLTTGAKTTSSNTVAGPSGGTASAGGIGGGLTPAQAAAAGTQGQTDYCTANPTAQACLKGSLSGGTSCGSAPTCSGDAVQCGVVYETWKTQCALNPDSSATSDLGVAVVGGSDPLSSAMPWATGQVTTVDVHSAFTAAQGSRTLSSTGLSDFTIPTGMGASVSVPMSGLNNSLSIAGYIVVCLSILGGVAIIGRG